MFGLFPVLLIYVNNITEVSLESLIVPILIIFGITIFSVFLIYKISKNIKNAIDDIYKDLKLNKNINSTILLSPAAASFDQFANFEKRGMHFKSLIIKKFRKN